MDACKRCFVISPIGPVGSPVREHADDVFDFIIQPAAKRKGYAAHRGDHNSMPGRISSHMFDAILDDPLIIAVLNFDNANVFYELAVAHAAARPLVILCERTQQLPFDVKDHRVIYYDLRPRPLLSKTYEDELVRAIDEVERLGGKIEVPFRSNLTPLGGLGVGFKLYDQLLSAVTEGTFPHNIINEAREFVCFSGTTLGSLHTLGGFEAMLTEAIKRGCSIEAYIMHEDNPALPEMLKDKSHTSETRHRIQSSSERWAALAQRHRGISFHKIRDGLLFHQVTMNEKRMLFIPYWTSRFPNEAPAIAATSQSAIYLAMRGELSALQQRNVLSTGLVQNGKGKGEPEVSKKLRTARA